MRGNELLNKLESIDPAYIEAAGQASKKEKNTWIKWATLAACLCLVVVVSMTYFIGDDTPDIPSVYYPEYTETSSFFYEGDVCENEVAAITHKSSDEKSITLSIDKKTDDLLTIAFKGWKSNKADVLVNNAADLMLYINGEETNQMPTAPGKYEVKIDYSGFAKKCDELDAYMYVSGFGYFCLNGEGYRIVGIDDISELTTSTEK